MFNPELYKRLEWLTQTSKPRGIGVGEVKIKAEGVPMTYRYVPDAKRTAPPGKPARKYEKLDIIDWGEIYSVCCPFCGDGRHRCGISYKAGVFDERACSTHKGLWKCFNESCQDNPENQEKMRDLLTFPLIRTTQDRVLSLERQYAHVAEKNANEPIGLPADVQALDTLPEDHPISVFLRTYKGGGWNPRQLMRNWEARAGAPRAAGASDRLIFPIREAGVMRGYQARYVGPYGEADPTGLWDCHKCWSRWECETNPKVCGSCGQSDMWPVNKWNTSTGTKLGKLFFNWDFAKCASDLLVVFEGPLDAVRAGTPSVSGVPGPCVSMFKSDISVPHQSAMLYEMLRQDKPVFLCFDADATEKSEKIRAKLIDNPQFAPFAERIICVRLPDGTDPAGLPHGDLWSEIARTAKEAGVSCELTR